MHNDKKIRAVAVLGVATCMSVLGRLAWKQTTIDAPMDFSETSLLLLIPSSCITWLILTPFLCGNRAWTIVPVGIISPFFGSALIVFGLFLAGSVRDPLTLGVRISAAGWHTAKVWYYIVSSASITLPIGLVTAFLEWSVVNVLLPPNKALRPPA